MALLRAQLALLTVLERNLNTTLSLPADQWTEGLVNSRYNLLEGYWNNFSMNHVQLLTADNGDAATTDYLKSDAYEKAEGFYTRAQGTLNDLHKRISPDAQPSNFSNNGTACNAGSGRRMAKLPRIEIQPFSGEQKDWEFFRDLFTSLYHNDPDLSDVNKLFFLQSHVRGRPKAAIDELPPTDANYTTAWAALKSRYDQRRLLIQEHMKALLRLRTVRQESAQGLQHLLDELRRHRNKLLALNRPVESWHDWFVYLGYEVMDSSTRRAWEEFIEAKEGDNSDVDPTFQQLSDFLELRCRMLRSMESVKTSSSSSSSASGDSKGTASAPRLTKTHATTTQRGCPACKEAHYIGHCITFRGLEPDERRRLVTDRGLCYNCLSSSHTARNCPSTSSCRNCSGSHHTLIHDGAGKRPTQRDRDDPPAKRTRAQTQTMATRQSPSREQESA